MFVFYSYEIRLTHSAEVSTPNALDRCTRKLDVKYSFGVSTNVKELLI